MTDGGGAIVPVWTLATGDVAVPALLGDGPMTAERLRELRGALAAMADRPIVTLELYSAPGKVERQHGVSLDAASPLARQLSELISRSKGGSPAVSRALEGGEQLYRMVVPDKFATAISAGAVRSMRSGKVAGGIHSALRSSKAIVGQATFVPVGTEAAGAAAAGGAAAVGGAAVAGGATAAGVAIVGAAPLVLMAVAVSAQASADRQRAEALEHITDLLEQLHEQQLEAERNELDGCRDAIDKATAILLDQGKLGVSLGLDAAVHAIGKALAAADRRLAGWQRALGELPEGKAVEIDALTEAFPGIDESGGVFRAHLELASLAVALKRRVIILQAVEHAQGEPGNEFEAFTRELQVDQQRLDKLESDIADVLVRLASLPLGRPRGWRAPVFTAGEVDRLLLSIDRIRSLDDTVAPYDGHTTDVAIEIARHDDGSVIVFPARPA